jgi:hypothetical protein
MGDDFTSPVIEAMLSIQWRNPSPHGHSPVTTLLRFTMEDWKAAFETDTRTSDRPRSLDVERTLPHFSSAPIPVNTASGNYEPLQMLHRRRLADARFR